MTECDEAKNTDQTSLKTTPDTSTDLEIMEYRTYSQNDISLAHSSYPSNETPARLSTADGHLLSAAPTHHTRYQLLNVEDKRTRSPASKTDISEFEYSDRLSPVPGIIRVLTTIQEDVDQQRFLVLHQSPRSPLELDITVDSSGTLTGFWKITAVLFRSDSIVYTEWTNQRRETRAIVHIKASDFAPPRHLDAAGSNEHGQRTTDEEPKARPIRFATVRKLWRRIHLHILRTQTSSLGKEAPAPPNM